MDERKYRTLQEFFDPYDTKHVEEALEYIEFHDFSPGFIPDDVVLSNPYGIQMHLLSTLATCWILYKTQGLKTKPVTH